MRLNRTNYAIYYILTSGLIIIASELAYSPSIFILSGIAAQIYFASRRLKDMNYNPWWAFLAILPIVSFILMFPKGTQGANQYGEDPRTLKKG